jgi:molybdate transport repressor ModE-like protein
MKPRSVSYLLDEEGARIFGPGPLELLRCVEQTGSLSSAAREMGMSYTKAMRIVHAAEKALGVSLTERAIGGEGGGSSHLTDAGKAIIHSYELWSAGVSVASDRAFAASFAGCAGASRLGCVLMAAGRAERFGRQKLVEELDGRLLVSRALDALLVDRLDVVVVSPWETVARICAARGVRCVEPAGPLHSDTVRAGLDALGERAGYLFAVGDQPLLSRRSVEALLDAFAKRLEVPARLCFGERVGNPVIFPAWMAPSLHSLEGDVGGGELLRRNPDLAAQTQLVQATSEAELEDVDTVSDLERIESNLGR